MLKSLLKECIPKGTPTHQEAYTLPKRRRKRQNSCTTAGYNYHVIWSEISTPIELLTLQTRWLVAMIRVVDLKGTSD